MYCKVRKKNKKRTSRKTILWLMALSAIAGSSWTYVYDHRHLLRESTASTERREEVKMTIEPQKEKEEWKTAKMGEFSAYTSEASQTDSTPFIMASGKRVYDGAIANNCLPFGNKVEVNGKTYTVEDRMNKRYGCDHFDIWFKSKAEALKFGRQQLEYREEVAQ